eukprot:12890150-Prorocentrum_lima.AAC.1
MRENEAEVIKRMQGDCGPPTTHVYTDDEAKATMHEREALATLGEHWKKVWQRAKSFQQDYLAERAQQHM